MGLADCVLLFKIGVMEIFLTEGMGGKCEVFELFLLIGVLFFYFGFGGETEGV